MKKLLICPPSGGIDFIYTFYNLSTHFYNLRRHITPWAARNCKNKIVLFSIFFLLHFYNLKTKALEQEDEGKTDSLQLVRYSKSSANNVQP